MLTAPDRLILISELECFVIKNSSAKVSYTYTR